MFGCLVIGLLFLIFAPEGRLIGLLILGGIWLACEAYTNQEYGGQRGYSKSGRVDAWPEVARAHRRACSAAASWIKRTWDGGGSETQEHGTKQRFYNRLGSAIGVGFWVIIFAIGLKSC